MKDSNKKKLFIENLEKRHSTSPLLIQVRTTEEFAMIEKFKKIMQVPDTLDKKMVQKTNPNVAESVKKLSDDKFLKRLDSKQKGLANAAVDRNELMEKIAGKTKSQADNKFVDRMVKKQENLNKIAIRKEELTGVAPKPEMAKRLSDDKFLSRIENKQKGLADAAVDRNELMEKIAGKTKSQADNKFVDRMVKKHENLNKIAIKKEELSGVMPKNIASDKLVDKSSGIIGWIKGLLKRHSDVYDPYAQEN